jgi:hypothetical protein
MQRAEAAPAAKGETAMDTGSKTGPGSDASGALRKRNGVRKAVLQ